MIGHYMIWIFGHYGTYMIWKCQQFMLWTCCLLYMSYYDMNMMWDLYMYHVKMLLAFDDMNMKSLCGMNKRTFDDMNMLLSYVIWTCCGHCGTYMIWICCRYFMIWTCCWLYMIWTCQHYEIFMTCKYCGSLIIRTCFGHLMIWTCRNYWTFLCEHVGIGELLWCEHVFHIWSYEHVGIMELYDVNMFSAFDDMNMLLA